MSFKPISEFHNRAIDKLVTQIDQQKTLLSVVKNALPEMLAEHTLHCVIHDAILIIYTDAAVWSSQLRFYQTVLLDVTSLFIQLPIKRVQIRLMKY
jgi:hypothetical protein